MTHIWYKYTDCVEMILDSVQDYGYNRLIDESYIYIKEYTSY